MFSSRTHNTFKLLLSIVGLFVLYTSQSETRTTLNALNNGEDFDLKVTLMDPYNRDLTLLTTLHPGQPFKLTAKDGATINTLSGMLHQPTAGGYPLDLTVSEWVSPTDNVKDTTNLKLELGKTWSGGPVSSFVFLRFVTLQRHGRNEH